MTLPQPEAMTDPVAQERAAIVAWLRSDGPMQHGCRYVEHRQQFCSCFANADAIERGEHLAGDHHAK